MAVGSLQEAGVSVTGQFCHRLLVYTVVKHSGHKIVTEGVKVELPGKSVLIIEPMKVPGKSIGVHQLTVLVREHIIAHLEAAFPRLVHFVVAVAAEDSCHLLADIDRPRLTVFSRPLHYTLPCHRASGAADCQNALVAVHDEVSPFQSAQLTTPAASVNR